MPNQPRRWKLGYIYCERAVVFRRWLSDSFFNLLISAGISFRLMPAGISFRLMPIILWANLAWKSESDKQVSPA